MSQPLSFGVNPQGIGRVQEFRYCDTQFQGMSEVERLQAMRTTGLPERGEEGWPSLRLENRVYRSRVFRKLHLELAIRQDGLQVPLTGGAEELNLTSAGWLGCCVEEAALHAFLCQSCVAWCAWPGPTCVSPFRLLLLHSV